MKNNSKKKGFTLVELLVVIAILAVLASVSVVGYLGFTAKANLSNDQQMIKMVNDNLMATSIDNKPESASEALTDLYGVGFSPEKLKPFSKDYHYSYNLKTNKMYLLDNNDSVVFPEESVNNQDMWGFYWNKTSDKLNNINNYVAMQSITHQETFDKVFTDETVYNIDLNNYLINVNGKSTITVSNGAVAPGKNFSNGGNAAEKKLFKKDDNHNYDSNLGVETVDNILTVKDYYVNVNKVAKGQNHFSNSIVRKLEDTTTTVVLKDIVFDGDNGNAYSPKIYTCGPTYEDDYQNKPEDKVAKIIIDSCKFINFKDWSLELGDSYKQYEVRNCEFINTGRGIAINPINNGFERRMYTSGSIIENNSFSLNAVDKYDKSCIQIAYVYDYNVDGANEETLDKVLENGPLYTFRNNKVLSANQLIYLHYTVSKNSSKSDAEYSSYANFKVMSNEQIKKAFVIENNSLKDKNAVLAAIREEKFTPEELVVAQGHLKALLGNN